jgi:hypothetical protein
MREHHHEDPGYAQAPGRRIPQLPDIAEVDLGDLARSRHDRDGDVFLPGTSFALNARDEAFDRSDAPAKLGVLAPKSVIDCRPPEPSSVQGRNLLLEHTRLDCC